MTSARYRIPLLLLALTSVPPVCAAEPLGRLFLTPERRAILERQRQANVQEQEQQSLEGATVSLDGVITRSSGRSTVWINGHPQHENTAGTGVQAGVSPRAPAHATITTGEEVPTDLRVGESVNRATREKSDVVAPGSVSVLKPRATAR
jgi:hypothetical protein